MGRIAVISDLHANLEATAAVLRDIEVRDVSEVLCAGDLVNYGPDPNGVVEFVRSRAIPSVMGNHDLAATFALQPADIRIGPGRNAQAEVESYQWTVAWLSLANKEFLARRPRVIRKSYGGQTVLTATCVLLMDSSAPTRCRPLRSCAWPTMSAKQRARSGEQGCRNYWPRAWRRPGPFR